MKANYKKIFLSISTSIFILSNSHNAFAAIFEWEYRGTISTVDNDLGWLTSPDKGRLSSTPIAGSEWSARVIYDTDEINQYNDIVLGKKYYDAISKVYISFGESTVLIETDGIGAMGRWGAETDLNQMGTDNGQYTRPEFYSRIYDIYPSEFFPNYFAYQGFDLLVRYSNLNEGEVQSQTPPNLDLAFGSYMSWSFSDEFGSGIYTDKVTGQIQSIKVISTPLPSTLWVFVSGLLVLVTKKNFRCQSH